MYLIENGKTIYTETVWLISRMLNKHVSTRRKTYPIEAEAQDTIMQLV